MKYCLIVVSLFMSLQAASFDCSKSISNIEKTICSYPHLDAMDEQLSQAYTNIKNSFSEEDKKILLNNQRVWLKKQKACETSESVEGCLKTLYEERIVFFNELAQNRFVRQNDVLTDRLTQMQWQDEYIVHRGHYDKKSQPSIKTWEEAKAYCKNLTLDGKSDWRLPNIEELRYAVSIKNRFKYGLDTGYNSSTMVDNYYLDTYKAISVSDYNPLIEDHESSISSASPYIRCVRGEALLEDSHTPLPKTVLAKNPFHLEMSQNDELCRSMEKIYNDDVQKGGMIHFDRHVEYNWLNWKKKVIFKKEDDYSSEKDSFGINSFDINNDRKVETVLFRRKCFNIYKDTDHTLDEVIYFGDDNKIIEYESMTLHELTKNKITKRFDTHERYRLFSSKEEFLNGDYILRPFKFQDGYYLSFFGTSGKEPFDERSYSDIVITQLDANHTLNDICHFKRTLQDTSKQELNKNLKIFHSSASAKERRDTLKMIIELGRYRENPAVIYESCEKGLSDKDEHIRSYSIDYIGINEKSIPLLLKTIIDDPNDINKIKATFNIGRYFTNNGSDPSEYYYVIDEHMVLALQAYDALVELGGRRRSNEMTNEMRNIMTSGMQFCDTNNYKNLDLIYQRFKGEIVPWDKEAYEKCQSKSK